MSAILFSYHPNLPIKGTLQKCEFSHDYEWIKEYRSKIYDRYLEYGFPEFANELIYIENVPEEEIEKMMDITGYVGIWYEELLKKENESL